MKDSMYWFSTGMPVEMVNKVASELLSNEDKLDESTTYNPNKLVDYRKSQQLWLPAEHWFSGWIMHYANLANKRNFGYDINGIFEDVSQYTVYHEGGHYKWHEDGYMISDGSIRKISYSLQLSDESEYTGGELQFVNEETTWFAPKGKGSLVFFDPRLRHRVRKVKSGTRRALVGWIGGPPWK
tara:strand:- start:167 stop:715 length:549 start_codon:yes stop_codon:yes gene_type:complete